MTDLRECPMAQTEERHSPLVISGRITKREICGFIAIARRGPDGDGPPIAYVAGSLEAVDICRALNSHQVLVDALAGLLNDIETGLLVRDVTRDVEPDWASNMMAFVQRLQKAQAALATAQERL